MRRIGLAALLALATGCATASNCGDIASTDGAVCAIDRSSSFDSAQLRRLADQTARERRALTGYLGNDVGPITLIVEDKGNARHRPPATIFIPARLIPKGHAITAHEMTHLLTQGWASLVLKEGLAVYAQYRFGEQQGWPNYRRSVHDAARHWLAAPGAGVRSVDDAETALRTRKAGETDRLLAAYGVAGSWVMWLIEERFGGEVAPFLARLYRSGDYRAALGQSFEDLETAWRAYIDRR